MPSSIRFGRPGSATSLSRTTNLPPIGSFTLMGWFRLTAGSAGGFSTFFAHGGTASSSYYFVGETNTLHFGVVVNGTTSQASALTTDRWYHVALTVNGTSGSNVLAYLNGVLDVTATAATVTAQKLWIGNQADSDWLNGNAAAIKMWNRVLTVDQIVAEIPYAVPVDWSGLNAAYPVANGWDIAASGLIVPRGTPLMRWADISGQTGNDWTEAGAIDTENGPPIQFAPERNFRPRYFVPAAGGGVSLTPGVGAVTATGFAPAIALPINVTPGVGAASAAGFAPAVSIGVRVAADVGAATLTGFAPAIATSNNQNVAAGSGALTLTGFAPAIVLGTRANPGVGAVTLNGFAPTVATPVNVLSGVGAATLSGFAPTVLAGAGATPGTGIVTLTGFAPTASATANQNVTAGQGAALLSGFAPTVFASDRRDLFPGLGQLTATGFAPTVVAPNPQNVLPGRGTLTATGFAATISIAPVVIVHLVDEPLFTDFDDLAGAIDFDDLRAEIDFDDLTATIVFTAPSGAEMLTLKILKGEVLPITFTLRGAGNAAQDLTGATSMKWNVGKPGALIISNADLALIAPAANGRVSYTPAPSETAAAGKYDALAIVTYPGVPNPIVRKFPGKVVIESAIA